VTPAAVHNVNFHGVGEPSRKLDAGEAMVWLAADRFLATLDALRGRDDVRISFDDGNRSDVDVALPALIERGITATFFVIAGRLGDPDHLGADDICTLAAAGMTVGSHGLHHRDWRRLGDAELTRELTESRRILEGLLGRPVTQAAVPFGSYDRRVLTQARRAGAYERVFTSDGGPARHGAWLQPRTSVGNDGVPFAALTARGSATTSAERAVKRVVKRWR
jgi:peptidoglycan/xylan/chitin deacetylase (PgdA/CDA1 family)